jgi:hypothetical protein
VTNIREDVKNQIKEYAGQYNSLVFAIIPREEDPVVIFKPSITPFELIAPSMYYTGKNVVFDFTVFWKGKFIKNDFPRAFLRHYNVKIQQAKDSPGGFVFPEGMFEIPLDAVLMKGIFQIDKNQFQLAKNVLRKYGLIEERRGKIRNISPDKKYSREFVVRKFLGMKRKKPLPIRTLQALLDKEVSKRYPKDSDEAKADKLKVSDSTIRRWVKPFIKK